MATCRAVSNDGHWPRSKATITIVDASSFNTQGNSDCYYIYIYIYGRGCEATERQNETAESMHAKKQARLQSRRLCNEGVKGWRQGIPLPRRSREVVETVVCLAVALYPVKAS